MIPIICFTAVECPKLYPPANGVMRPEDRYIFETNVEITCDVGYMPDDDNRKSCQANQQWSGDGRPFSCIGKSLWQSPYGMLVQNI